MENGTTSVRRKGALRMDDIPPEVLRALNEGRDETITLPEGLAIDHRALMRCLIGDAGLQAGRAQIEAGVDALAGKGVVQRVIGAGRVLFEALDGYPDRAAVYERIASHRSDMVRSWASYIHTADPSLTMVQRLAAARRFAADPHSSVRESAWDSYRPWFAKETALRFELLEEWVRDADANVRRCAVESTRPCGVWTAHIPALKRDPAPGLRILEHVRSDPSLYVRKSVGNWLNDAAKYQPDWVRQVCERWARESPTRETLWTVGHGMRGMRREL